MKNTIICLLLLCSISAQAQEITKDSTAIELIGGKYYSARYLEYENGNTQTIKTIIGSGTTLDVFNQSLNTFRQRTSSMATDAVLASGIPKSLTEIKRQNDAIKTLLGKSPLDTIQAREIATYLAPGWTMKTAGVATPVDVVFSVLANGQMRHNLGSAPRNVTFFGDAMRLHNFPNSGATTDFFRLQNGNFTTLDRAYILRRPGSNQQSAQQRTTKRQ